MLLGLIMSCLIPSSPSSLFPDVVNCMQTDNLELKKLVYLYLMNYAKSQPDMAIMAVNSFVKVGEILLGYLRAELVYFSCCNCSHKQEPTAVYCGNHFFPSRIVRTPIL